jgi:hypothetical protein
LEGPWRRGNDPSRAAAATNHLEVPEDVGFLDGGDGVDTCLGGETVLNCEAR